jgi:hypothetical protein
MKAVMEAGSLLGQAKHRYIKYLKTGAEELYDHSNDPNEWTNVIDRSAYRTVREELSALVPDEMTVLGSWDAPGDAVTEHNQWQTYLYRRLDSSNLI